MKKSGCLVAGLFVAVCLSMFGNLILLAVLGVRGENSFTHAKVLPEKFYEEEILVEGKNSHDRIAVIPLEGVIGFGQEGALGDSMVEDFKAAMQQAAEDPHVKAVILAIDSPGGEVTASDVLYNELMKFRADKPVIAYFNSIGASGAYYTACGADWIMCNDTTFTGSIGVIISTLNYRELFGKIGLESLTFKSGKFKDMLNGAREMTPDEKAYVQGLVMQSYDRFVGIVAKSRKLDERSLRNGVADGRILSGTDALASKLVDQLGYVEDAYKKAMDLAEAPGAEVVRYVKPYSWRQLLHLFAESRAPKVQIEFPGKKYSLQPGRVYLLPDFFAP